MKNHRNLLFVMSDQHSRKVSRFAGHRFAQTPTLDKLSTRGTWFDNAYTTSPICVPARASIATGRYLFESGYWDNADAYDGRVPSWHHQLRDAGYPVVAIGKLHFRDAETDFGFTDVRLPMHIPNGKGDLLGLIRDKPRERAAAHKLADTAGPGESDYTRYDRSITREAIKWLAHDAKTQQGPWTLLVSFVAPHFPLIAPPDFFAQYANLPLDLPKLYAKSERPQHPAIDFYRSTFTYDDYFHGPAHVQRALAAYYGLVSFMDDNIRQILLALEEAGLANQTDVLYTSDHGDNLGARGLWGKSTMYEESVGVPLLVAGDGYASHGRSGALVSHVDITPFILEHFGLRDEVPDQAPQIRRRSLFSPNLGDQRAVLAEYHATGSKSAAFMLRKGHEKLVHYVDGPAQFFDLLSDPEELKDCGADPACAGRRDAMEALLAQLLEPVKVDAKAKERQTELRSLAGGDAMILASMDYGYSPAPQDIA
jgi:choline-sulfatase